MKNQKLSFISTIIIIANPASIFFTAVYTESLFTLVTLFSFYLFFSNIEKVEEKGFLDYFRILRAPIGLLMISVFIRSNALFYISIPGYYILKDFISCIFDHKIKKAFMLIFIGLLSLILLMVPYFMVVYYADLIYCSVNSEAKPPYCFESFQNAYDYNQKKHWNVGFLEQYKLSRIIFIYWGLHTLIIVGLLIIGFLKEKWLSFCTLGFLGEKKENKEYSEKWNPFMIYTLILFAISVFLAHTQSCTRFFSSCPCFSWYLASQIFGFQKSVDSNEKEEEKLTIQNKWLLLYIIYFNVAGHCMFSNYLPWT